MSAVSTRLRPCASCPYRRDVPSGIWHQDEYEKLRQFDGDAIEQIGAGVSESLFFCHQATTEHKAARLCAGWVGHREEPYDLIGIRTGIARGRVDPSVLDYTTDVPLWSSGAEAAEHGERDLSTPSKRAVEAARKVMSNPNRPDLEI